jgi:hypothetical protein
MTALRHLCNTLRLLLLLLAPVVGVAQDYEPYGLQSWFAGHEEWLKCQSDDQCTLIQVADIMGQTRHRSVDTALKYVRIGQLFDRKPEYDLGTLKMQN